MRPEGRNIELANADISQDDVDAVVEVLRSGRLALGPKAVEFEARVAEYVGVRHAVAVSSGTAGLHAVLVALGLGPGDEVIVPSFTFAASLNVILLVGATPVFADIEPVTFNLDVEDVRRRITAKTRAIMVVDVFGHPADWDALSRLADEFNLALVDDSCEALGSEYHGRSIGGFGAAGVFAFYPNKQITTGEGGVVVTNDAELAATVRSLRNQGRSPSNTWLQHERLGFNYRMDEMSAALGASQMRRVGELIRLRQAVFDGYQAELARVQGVRLPRQRENTKVSWFVYVVLLDHGIDRERAMAALDADGVPTRTYFPALHLQPYVRDTVTERATLPVTEDIAARTLALPFHPHLSLADIRYVARSLRAAVGEASPA